MAIILNQQGDCESDTIRGMGVGDCTKERGEPVGFDLYPKRWSLNIASGTLPTEDEYKGFIQGGTIYNFNDSFMFDNLTPANGAETSDRGVKKTNLLGLPEFQFDFVNGYCFHTNAFDKRGFNRWDVVIKYEAGMLFTYDIGQTKIGGFDCGDFNIETFTEKKGTDSSKTSIMFQFKNALEYNTRGTFYTWDELGYDATQIDGVLNAKLSYSTAPTAATTFSVKAVNDCNGSVNVLGMTDANNWFLGGVQASATTINTVAYNAETNSYDFTLDTALVVGDTIQPSLGDVTNSYSAAVNASGQFYKGSAPLSTVA